MDDQQEKFEHSEIKTGVHTHKCSHQRDNAMCVSTGKRGNGAKMLAVTHCVQVGAEALGLTLTNSCINLGSEKSEPLTAVVVHTKTRRTNLHA